MPLKVVPRKGSENLYIRGTVAGQTIFESTGTASREKAEAFKSRRENELWDRRIHGAQSTVTLLEAAVSYLEHEPRSENTKALVHRLLDHFCPTWDSDSPDPSKYTLARDVDQEKADRACKVICRPGASRSTHRRNVYTPLSAILAHAARRKWCAPPAFDLPRQPKGRTRWLKPDEAVKLIEGAANHLRPLFLFYLCTGARVGEALDLDWDHMDLPAGTCVLRDTKNGLDRVVKLPPRIISELANMEHKQGPVFLSRFGRRFADSGRTHGGQIRGAFLTACENAGLTDLRPHDLRHTWATWFYATTKDPIRLKQEGGWQTLALVERYAHLMPSQLVPSIKQIWGCAHPDAFPANRAESVQNRKRRK